MSQLLPESAPKPANGRSAPPFKYTSTIPQRVR
jgi:hypothetical protein